MIIELGIYDVYLAKTCVYCCFVYMRTIAHSCPHGQREALEQNVLATDFGNSNSCRSVHVD